MALATPDAIYGAGADDHGAAVRGGPRGSAPGRVPGVAASGARRGDPPLLRPHHRRTDGLRRQEEKGSRAQQRNSSVFARDASRKRSRGAEALRVVTSGTTTVDGFIWKKYGQKDINGRNHPRLYYRCAYRHQGCAATRRVQQTQEEPPAYEIGYYGEHTCRGAAARQDAAALPPTVVDFGWDSGTAPAASEHPWSWDGEMSQRGWSSTASSEADFEAQTTHEWHDTARVVEQPRATPCYASDPVTVFLDGCFDWESVINDFPFEFGALHHTATLQ